MIAWRDSLLKDEMGAMTQLRRRVKIGVLLMLTTATAGYFVMNHILLSDMAVDNINSYALYSEPLGSSLVFARSFGVLCAVSLSFLRFSFSFFLSF